jgi:PAS domain-containing protein
MIGYSCEELLTMVIGDIESVESAEEAKHHMATIIDTGFDRFETQHRRKDGSDIEVEGSVSFSRDTGWFLCFARDITDRKRAEHVLQMSEWRYRDLFEATRDAIMVFDVNSGRCISANSSALIMFGVADEQEFFACQPWDRSPERQPDGVCPPKKPMK